MMCECFLTQRISGEILQQLILDPKDYLYCESREELERYVQDDLRDSIDYGDVCIEILDNKFDIPDKFYETWETLKNNE